MKQHSTEANAVQLHGIMHFIADSFHGGRTVKTLICVNCGEKLAQLFPPREMKKPEGARRLCRMCIRATNRL
jgi:hypothetical protein